MKEQTTGVWPDPTILMVSLIIIAVSVIVLVVCAILWRKRSRFRAECSLTVDGVVSEIRESRDSEGTTLRSPVFTYDAGGGRHELKPKTWSSSSRLHVGDRVTVHVDPYDPSRAWVEQDKVGGILIAAFAGVSVFDILVAVVLLFLFPVA